VLTLAADHERAEYEQRGPVLDFGPGFLYDPNQDQTMGQTGVAAEYLTHVGRSLSLSASVRHDDYSDFDGATTWRATGSWSLPAGHARLHGSAGTGVKTPTFTERFGYYPDQFIGNPDLRPETSLGWDAGVEGRFGDGRIVADVTYFRADLEHEINGLYCPVTEPVCTAINETGDSHRKGVELSLDASIGARYAINAAYSYSDSTQPGPEGGQQRELRRPLHATSLNLNGRWLDQRLDVNVGVGHTSERIDNHFDPLTFEASRVGLDAYTLVNLAASFDLTPAVTVYARLENAFDEDYEDVHGFNAPGASGTVGLRLDFKR
jgi:vitamin B12 transporter